FGGGTSGLGTGGLYDPATDTWAPTSLVNAPTPRLYHSAIWTGSKMIVWGGADYDTQTHGELNGGEVNTGGSYDPVADTWTPTTLNGAPRWRQLHSAVWTGNEMIIFGGWDDNLNFDVVYSDGARYDPATDSWMPLPTAGAPAIYG